MSSEEVAQKLQRRLDTKPEPPVHTGADEEKDRPAAAAVNGDATSELTEKLNRRLDIHDGTTKPKQMKVFNPYTEFKEFSRKQIKDMETMFKRSVSSSAPPSKLNRYQIYSLSKLRFLRLIKLWMHALNIIRS